MSVEALQKIEAIFKQQSKEHQQKIQRITAADKRDFPKLDPKYFPDIKKLDTWHGEYEKAIRAFNENLGNPFSRILNKRVTQVEYLIQYEFEVEKYHYEIVDKTRKGGFTDGRIRGIARQVFGRYASHDVMIIAGNELVVAMEILDRFDELFENGITDKNGKLWKYGDLIYRYAKSPQPIVEFYNGTRAFCFAASKSGKAQAFRGPDDVISIFMSEAAHSGAIDDYPIYNALTPNLANRPDGDLVFESTPNGKRGFYYDVWTDSIVGKNHYHPLEVTWERAVEAGVLSIDYVNKQRKDPRVDFEQEYCGKFTTTKRAAIPADEVRVIEDEHMEPIDLSKELGYDDYRD